MRIACCGKGNVAQAEDQAAMGHAVKIEHRFGHHQRDPAVAGFNGLDGGAEQVGIGIFVDILYDIAVDHDALIQILVGKAVPRRPGLD